MRSLVICATLMLLARVFRWRIRPLNWRPVALRSLFFSSAMVLYFGAAGIMPIAQVGAGLFSAPIFVLVISALRHDDPGVLALYRERLEHPDATVRGTIAEIAMAYNYEVLLEEMSVREPDLELREEIEAVLDGGIPFEEHDPYEDASADEGVEVLGDDDIESAAIILGDDDLESAESGIRPRRKG